MIGGGREPRRWDCTENMAWAPCPLPGHFSGVQPAQDPCNAGTGACGAAWLQVFIVRSKEATQAGGHTGEPPCSPRKQLGERGTGGEPTVLSAGCFGGRGVLSWEHPCLVLCPEAPGLGSASSAALPRPAALVLHSDRPSSGSQGRGSQGTPEARTGPAGSRR